MHNNTLQCRRSTASKVTIQYPQDLFSSLLKFFQKSIFF